MCEKMCLPLTPSGHLNSFRGEIESLLINKYHKIVNVIK